MSKNALYFITGSSGAGKTTLLKGVVESVYPNLSTYHSDDLGVPSIEEMNAKFGGPAQWQAHNIRQWIEKVAHSNQSGLVVLDSQARPTAILDTANETGFSALHVTLIDCSHAERRRRLIEYRAQPELDNLDMYAWAAYLRGQADALRLEIIDTTTQSLTESIQELASSIGHFAEENGICLEFRKDTRQDLRS
jgi:energy-coupling factor transporter ATP-binding protein EcfA2